MEPLTKDHSLFTAKSKKPILVVTTYETWADRHGPIALKRWRKKMGIDESDLDANDPKWPANLSGKFSLGIFDESHMLKTLATRISIAILWLDLNFHFFASATPIPNGIEDLAGYVKFIAPKDGGESLWTKESLKKMDIKRKADPFFLDDDHPGTKLRITEHGIKQYLLHGGIPVQAQGQRLAMLWTKFMLRRTNASRIPIGVGPTIGDQLPGLSAVAIECSYSDKERTEYETKEAKILKLPPPGQDRPTDFKAPKYSLTMHRSLQLLTASLNLSTLDTKFKLKSANLKKLFGEPNFSEKWFSHLVAGGVKGDDVLGRVAALLDGSPKLRALIKNLRDQVSISGSYWQRLTIMQTIRDQDKAMIFVQIPATGVLVYVVLKLIGLEVGHISAYMTSTERQATVDRFNKKGSGLMALVMPYAIAAVGLNLQNDCWRVHCFEQPHNIAIASQAIGRARRLGNPSKWVYVYEYTIPNTFDSRGVKRNIEKAIPQAFAELNQNVIFMKGPEDDEDEDQEFTTIDWVEYNGVVQKRSEAELAHGGPLDLPNLDPFELIVAILQNNRGKKFVH